MSSMYSEEAYNLHPLAKPAPLPAPGERRRDKILAGLALSCLFCGCFMQTVCRVCVFEGSFHSRLEHNSCSYVGDEAAFHFVLQSYGWASEKIMHSCFMKCCCCIGTVTVELRQKKKSLSSVFLVCTRIQEFVRCKETHISVVSFYPKKILPNKKYFSVLL